MTSDGDLQDQLARLAPDIPRCMGNSGDNKAHPDIVDRAIKHKCQMVQLFKPYFDQSTVDRAHAAGMRVNVFWSDDPTEAKKFLDMGIDTILTNDYLLIANATGLK
jgi:glycerophosphoryl diester phosphodiesterase